MTLRPANTIAEQVQRLRSLNADLDVQICELTKRQADNLDAIAALEPHAEWIEEPEPEEAADDVVELVENDEPLPLEP